jgi:hypothetical protein
MIGRVYFASITKGEQYYIRLLLLHQQGPTSFNDLKTVNGVTYCTFREAANKLGLLVLDWHYVQCMTDAAHWMTGHSLLLMFCMLTARLQILSTSFPSLLILSLMTATTSWTAVTA